MTYAELSRRMSASEFEMWVALDMLRQDECPNCGVEPRDLMEYGLMEAKCPVCGQKHGKIKRYTSFIDEQKKSSLRTVKA